MMVSFQKSNRKRAAVGPFVAVSIVALVGCAMLAVDVGHMYVANEEMQNAVDASALAGASAVCESNALAVGLGMQYATHNKVAGQPVGQHEANVIVGYWEGSTHTFFPFTGTEPTRPNAVRSIGTRPDLPLFFARLFGFIIANVERDAVATSGSGTCAGIWGLELIDGDGDLITDSYDSSKGAYGTGNIFNNGDICSNRDIVLEGGVEIHGDAMNGADYSFLTYGSSMEIWGVMGAHRGEMFAPPFDMAAAQATNDNATIGLTDRGRDPFGGSLWDLNVTGNDGLTLAGGTYYFTSALIDGQATVTVTGPTTMYISGPADFTGGGLINITQDPKNLIIYSTGATMTIDGTAGFYGGVIAPQTEVTLTGTSEYFGTIMAKTLNMFGNTVMHVDERLIFDLLGIEPEVPLLVE